MKRWSFITYPVLVCPLREGCLKIPDWSKAQDHVYVEEDLSDNKKRTEIPEVGAFAHWRIPIGEQEVDGEARVPAYVLVSN